MPDLTTEEKESIRRDEMFREEVRKELAKGKIRKGWPDWVQFIVIPMFAALIALSGVAVGYWNAKQLILAQRAEHADAAYINFLNALTKMERHLTEFVEDTSTDLGSLRFAANELAFRVPEAEKEVREIAKQLNDLVQAVRSDKNIGDKEKKAYKDLHRPAYNEARGAFDKHMTSILAR